MKASVEGEANRALIQSLVEEDPGIHVSEIADRVGRSWHTTAHHLALLQRAGKVAVEKAGRDRRVFPAGIPARHRRWLAAMRVGQSRAIVRALLDGSRLNVPELSHRLGCSEKVVRRRISDLVRAGLVGRIGTWHPVYEVKRSDALQVASLLPKPPVGAWEWDPVGGRSTVSEDGWRVLGVAAQPGRSCMEFVAAFVHPDDRVQLKAVVGTAIAEGLSYEHTVRLRTPLGERRIRQRGWVVARDADGKAIRYGGTMEDVTDVVKAGLRSRPVPLRQAWGLPQPQGSKVEPRRRPAGGLRAMWGSARSG
ncbi:MAG: hypothetical protein QOJ26_92 [Thermoplasmata archaeon]|nr:hypothetical protein [Thermoplasmata archaeon]